MSIGSIASVMPARKAMPRPGEVRTNRTDGAQVVYVPAGEFPMGADMGRSGEVPLHRLWHAVPAFPTISEVWLRLLETYGL